MFVFGLLWFVVAECLHGLGCLLFGVGCWVCLGMIVYCCLVMLVYCFYFGGVLLAVICVVVFVLFDSSFVVEWIGWAIVMYGNSVVFNLFCFYL